MIFLKKTFSIQLYRHIVTPHIIPAEILTQSDREPGRQAVSQSSSHSLIRHHMNHDLTTDLELDVK